MRRLCSVFLCLLLLCPQAAFAVLEEEPDSAAAPSEVAAPPLFPDLDGHWAEEALLRAVSEGLLLGFTDGTLRPEAPVNGAEALSLLTRVLDARLLGEVSGLSGREWYYEAARKAAALGLDGSGEEYWKPLSRAAGARLLERAFSLRHSAESPALSAYRDVARCTLEERRALSTLTAAGYMEGYGGLLEPFAPLTRAELITILYRILDEGRLLGGEVVLEGAQSGPHYLNCTATGLTLKGAQLDALTVLSQQLEKISFSGQSRVERLTLGGGSGETFHFSTNGGSNVESLVIGAHYGPVVVESPLQTLLIEGPGQRVTLNAPVERLILLGYGAEVTVQARVSFAEVYGAQTALDGEGQIDSLRLQGGSFAAAREALIADWQDERDPGLTELSLSAQAPEFLPVGEALSLTVRAENPRDCALSLLWQQDGRTVHEEQARLGPQGAEFTHSYPVDYTRNMAPATTLGLILRYTDRDGVQSDRSIYAPVALENYPESHYITLAQTVVSGYRGDYTKAWAEQNDYSPEAKTAWVNAGNYSSKTGYLLWINLSHQRVNVFTGSRGNWTLQHSFLCATGRPGHGTPTGTYTVTARKEIGWTTRSYHVSPVLNFTNARYKDMAFHSRKYDSPQKNYLVDDSIGFPVSDGCVRMYDEDARWLFDTMPNGTLVVVF